MVGRNEGRRLSRCLTSLPERASVVVYVDSGSTDGSAELAARHGADVICLSRETPFTAARARNAGLRRLKEIVAEGECVHFVDADCELAEGWTDRALAFLEEHEDVAVVSGRLRERHPEQSTYNWLCDREWDAPSGEARACGGIAMMRIQPLENVGGFREDLIAGEEPELCVRLRAAGWRIWRLDRAMGLHDANILRLAQWWQRAERSGYAFAQGAQLHGAPPERHWVWESRRALIWGLWLPIACTMLGVAFGPLAWGSWLIYPTQVLRQTFRSRGSLGDRTRLAFFQIGARFPEAIGQLKFMRDHWLRRQGRLIEYK